MIATQERASRVLAAGNQSTRANERRQLIEVQERMTQTVADMIEKELESIGVAVVIQAEHSCMSIRGVKKHGSSTVTSALRGIFKTNQSSRAEVLSLISQKPL
jgi:GTP cyclohydrolase I